MSRPEFGKPKVGDRLVLRGGVPGFRYELAQAIDVQVVSVGPKYVHVVHADCFDTYDRERDRWHVRKFLIADQREGEPGRRVGYSATVATAEQHAYDLAAGEAVSYLQSQGIELARASAARGRVIEIAAAVRDVLEGTDG